jgi:formylglycine-generating enzyme required for sulfatase activity
MVQKKNKKNKMIRLLLFVACFACVLSDDEWLALAEEERFEGPIALGLNYTTWRAAIDAWRILVSNTSLVQSGPNCRDSPAYRSPQASVASHSHVQTQLMMQDLWFYSRATGNYTVGAYLDKLELEYGGIDQVLVWAAYPNLGVDNRNQYDFLRDLPGGGLDALAGVVERFHARGVRVLMPFNPWDEGTKDESVAPQLAMAELMASVNADGFNGDTMYGVDRSYYDAAVARLGRAVLIEPELSMRPVDDIGVNLQGWGYWDPYTAAPYVSKYKLLCAGHQTHICERWASEHRTQLHNMLFNRAGFVAWQNVWGIYRKMVPRDAELLRRVARVLAEVDRVLPPADADTEWLPFLADVVAPQHAAALFASVWRNERARCTAVLLTNAASSDASAPLFAPAEPSALGAALASSTCVDLYRGTRGQCERATVEAHGVGALLACDDRAAVDDATLLRFAVLTRRPLSSYSTLFTPLRQRMVPIASTRLVGADADLAFVGNVSAPLDDVLFHFVVSGIEIEGDNRVGVDVQYPWELEAHRNHDTWLRVRPFFIETSPVTCDQYEQFVAHAGYAPPPADAPHFLEACRRPSATPDQPATSVSLDDARAYCESLGRRLPHDWEWQLAAQGPVNDGRLYPWGNGPMFGRVPLVDTSREPRVPDSVHAHCPRSQSPYGVCDMVGNVWQWTDEFADEHTRAALVRGGSLYQPQGSKWYFPQAYENSQHGKLLLMAPSIDRAQYIGFRCVQDSQSNLYSTLPKLDRN